jgi:Tfp pilus assembly protein PilN
MKYVVIELLAGRMDIVVFQGSRRTAAKRLSFPEVGANDWPATIRSAVEPLKRAVNELGAQGLGATVLFRSPTQAVDLIGYQVRSGAEAVEAARLNFTEALPYPARLAVCEGVVVARDRRGGGRKTHVIVAAEREDCSEAMVHLVESAGLRVNAVVPRDAAVVARLVDRACRRRQEAIAWLYIGEHASFFLVIENGAIVYNRRIDVGVETLARTLAKHDRTAEDDAPVLDIDAARDYLADVGLPDPEGEPAPSGVRAGELFHQLQPILQRYMLELRQSLRFGVGESATGQLRIQMTGPGAKLRGLAELIAAEVGLDAVGDEAYDRFSWSQPGSAASEMMDALRVQKFITRMTLLPPDLAERHRTLRLRHWLWTGAAVAVLVIGFDTFRYHSRLTKSQEQATASTARLADLEALALAHSRLQAAIGAMGDLDQRIDEQMGQHIDYRACLHELSRLTPAAVRYTGLTLEHKDDGTRGSIMGFAFPEEATPRASLESFIEQLENSPLFTNVELGNVQRGEIGGREGQRFEAGFKVIDMRDDPEPVLLAVSPEAAEVAVP